MQECDYLHHRDQNKSEDVSKVCYDDVDEDGQADVG